jgi:hypothetical protein
MHSWKAGDGCVAGINMAISSVMFAVCLLHITTVHIQLVCCANIFIVCLYA